jgi:hypothetical protein
MANNKLNIISRMITLMAKYWANLFLLLNLLNDGYQRQN